MDIKKILRNAAYTGGEDKNAHLIDMNSVTPYYKLTSPSDPTLIFESRFESGNLFSALKVSDEEYNLLLSNDVNTSGHTQWFFFRVGNTWKG